MIISILNYFKNTRNIKIAIILVLLGIIGIIIYVIMRTYLKSKSSNIRLRENFNTDYQYLDNVNEVLFNDGYYNLSFNRNLLKVNSATNTLDTIKGITQSNDLDTIFAVFLLNRTNSINIGNVKESKCIIIPLKTGINLGKEGSTGYSIEDILGVSTTHTPYYKDINFGDNDDRIFTIEEINGRKYIYVKSGNDKLYLTGSSVSNKILLNEKNENINENQELLFQKVEKIQYHEYDTGYYKLQLESTDTNDHIVRLERVMGELNTYNIVEYKFDTLPNNQAIYLNGVSNIELLQSNNNNNKNIDNNKFIVQRNNEESINRENIDDEIKIVRNNSVKNYFSNGGKLVSYKEKVGLRNGYYFISYNVGTDYYLVTYQNNKLIGIKSDIPLKTQENAINIISKSLGDNIFLVKNLDGSQHSIQIANKELFLNLNNMGSGNYSLGFNDNSNEIVRIFKEAYSGDNYTMNYNVPNVDDNNSNNNGISMYINRNGDELSINRNNLNTEDTSTRFTFHKIANDEINLNPSSNLDTKECTFYSNFIKIKKSNNITVVYSVNDTNNNPYKENEFRDLNVLKKCNQNSNVSNIYLPEYVDQSGKYVKYDENKYQKDTSYETIEDRNASGIKIHSDKTIYQCLNECQTDLDCKKFLFSVKPEQNDSEAYLGDCVIIHNTGLSSLKPHQGGDVAKYAPYQKREEVISMIPSQMDKEPEQTVPDIINNRDESCTIRGPDMCEDKEYCYLKGQNCLRKCAINPLNGTSISLDRMDTDMNCIGTLNDFDIVFQEIDRNFEVDSISNSITVKLMDISLINITKRVHKPILNYNNGLMIKFVCIGNNARDTSFELPINYKLSNDDHRIDGSNEKLILGKDIDQINIQVPEEVVQCSKRGYKLVLKIKLTDIYNYSKVIDVIPMDKENNIMYDVKNKINNQEFNSKMIYGRSLFNAVQTSLDSF